MKYLLLILLTLSVFMASCGNVNDTDGKIGNEKEETAATDSVKDKASDAVKDATDGASDAVKDVTDGASDMMDDVSDAFDKATGALSGEVLGITRLTTDQAQYAALSDAGFISRDVTFYKTYLHNTDGRVYYDVEFATSDAMYDYEIDSLSGDILKREERTLR